MTQALVARLFRHESRRLIATLARRTGELDRAEEAVQEAMLRALKTWPARGVPKDPAAWLYTVARNHLVDQLRARRDTAELNEHELPAGSAPPAAAGVLADEGLCLLFACAHPELTPEERLPLMLSVAVGLGSSAIGRALSREPAAVRKRISRAKARLRDLDLELTIPAVHELPARLGSVLEGIYGLFSLGHAATGDELIELGLCEEAVRFAQLLCAGTCSTPATHALAALCLLTAARFPARLEAGAFVSLRDQNRALWDRAALSAGLRHLERAATGEELSRYHLEAGIAAAHATAPSYAETDWPRVVRDYDALCARYPNVHVRLNRAIALAEANGPQAGLDALRPLATAPELRGNSRYHAAHADLLLRLGRRGAAARELKRALHESTTSTPERRALERRLADLREPS